MSEQPSKATPPATQKKPIQILRDKRGGIPRHLVHLQREQRRIRARIIEALRDGAKTVPELATALDLPPHDVLRYVMGLKKYGKVGEGDQVEGYFQYRIIEDPRPTEKAS